MLHGRTVPISAIRLLAISVVLAAAFSAWAYEPERALHGPFPTLGVVDGDTIKVQLQGTLETIRLIGIDTPETVAPGEAVEPYGPEASAYTKGLVGNQQVWLEIGVEQRDQYGRLLAYAYLEDANGSWEWSGMRFVQVNHQLALSGLANLLTIYPTSSTLTSILMQFRTPETPVGGCGQRVQSRRCSTTQTDQTGTAATSTGGVTRRRSSKRPADPIQIRIGSTKIATGYRASHSNGEIRPNAPHPMSSPVEDIEVLCPACGTIYTDWYRASLNLDLDEFDEDYIEEASTATCPKCGHTVALGTLIVRWDGVYAGDEDLP